MTSAVPGPRNLSIAGIFFGIAAIVLALVAIPSVETSVSLVLVAVLGAVCAIPVVTEHLRGRAEPFGLLNLVCLIWFVQLGMGTLYLLYDERAAYDGGIKPWVSRALLLSIIGVASMVYGWGLASRLFSPPPAVRMVPSRGAAWIVAIYLLGLFGQYATLKVDRVAYQTGIVSAGYSLFIQFSALSLVVYFLLFFLFFDRQASPAQKALLFLVVVPTQSICLAYYLGNKTFCMTLLALPLIAFHYSRGKLPSRAVVPVVLLIVFAVFPFFNAYRTTSRSYSISTRVGDTVDHLLANSSSSYQENSIFQVGNRLALINSVAVIIRESGSSVEYQYGRTLGNALVGFLIPRIVWPDKPVVSIGREFARRFRIQPRWDDKTWVAPTIIGELYWNFHVPGVVLGMVLLGLLLRTVYRFFGQPGALDPLNLAMYAGLIVPLLNVEQNVGSYLGTLVKSIVILAALQWGLRSMGIVRRVSADPARNAG